MRAMARKRANDSGQLSLVADDAAPDRGAAPEEEERTRAALPRGSAGVRGASSREAADCPPAQTNAAKSANTASRSAGAFSSPAASRASTVPSDASATSICSSVGSRVVSRCVSMPGQVSSRTSGLRLHLADKRIASYDTPAIGSSITILRRTSNAWSSHGFAVSGSTAGRTSMYRRTPTRITTSMNDVPQRGWNLDLPRALGTARSSPASNVAIALCSAPW